MLLSKNRLLKYAIFLTIGISSFSPKTISAQAQSGTNVKGRFVNTDIGPLGDTLLEVYVKDAKGNLKEIKPTFTRSGPDGGFTVNIPDKYKNELNNGNLYIKAASVVDPLVGENFVVQNIDGDIYRTDAVLLRNVSNEKDQVINAVLGETEKGAFKAVKNIAAVNRFFTSANFENGKIHSDEIIQKATFDLFDQKINFIYPSPNPTGHDAKWFFQGKDVIHIEDLELDSGQSADGEGDTIAHEFTHSLMNMYYGDYDWFMMTRKLGEHFPGDVMDDRSAFVEDISYFFESAFDGALENDVIGAGYREYVSEKGEMFDKNRKLWEQAKERLAEAVKNNNTADIQKYRGVMSRAQERAEEDRLKYNAYVGALKENPDKIDGLGTNILWEMYGDASLGGREVDKLRKFISVLSEDQPKNMTDFYEKWIERYPTDKGVVERIYRKHGYFQDHATYTEIPAVDWGTAAANIETSTVIIVDASGSMEGAKIRNAKNHARRVVRSAKKDEEVTLIVFNDCNAVKLVQEFTLLRKSLYDKIDPISASGSTPIAASLNLAQEYLHTAHNGKEGKITLITDGGESCSGKPKDAASGIRKSTYKIKFNVVGYNLTPDDKKELKDIAKAGGGSFKTVKIWDGANSIKEEARAVGAVGAAAAAVGVWAFSMGQMGAVMSNLGRLGGTAMNGARAVGGKVGQIKLPGGSTVGQKVGSIAGRVGSKAITNLKSAGEKVKQQVARQVGKITHKGAQPKSSKTPSGNKGGKK